MNNKTILSTLLAALLLLTCFGCAQSQDAPATSANAQTAPATSANAQTAPTYATVGELLADTKVNHEQRATFLNRYIDAFELNGVYYRAVATLTDEQEQAIFDLDWNDPDHDAKEAEILNPIAIDSIENLTEQIPAQAELDKLVGKTGKDLLDEGWSCGGYNLDDMEFWMSKDPFSYSVIFDSNGDKPENTDDFDAEEAIQSYTVKSVTYQGLGDATNIFPEE